MKKNVVAFPTPTASLHQQLKTAIANKRLIEFTYDDARRVAEPHDYGQRKGIDKVLVYQRKKGGSYKIGWRSIEVSKLEDLVVRDDTFRGSRNEPHQHHIVWDVLYARGE